MLALVLCALGTVAREARGDEAGAPSEPYFYKGYDYGSQALYGPLWVFLNRGYDVLQDRAGSRSIFQQEYRHNGETVGRKYPERSIQRL